MKTQFSPALKFSGLMLVAEAKPPRDEKETSFLQVVAHWGNYGRRMNYPDGVVFVKNTAGEVAMVCEDDPEVAKITREIEEHGGFANLRQGLEIVQMNATREDSIARIMWRYLQKPVAETTKHTNLNRLIGDKIKFEEVFPEEEFRGFPFFFSVFLNAFGVKQNGMPNGRRMYIDKGDRIYHDRVGDVFDLTRPILSGE